MLMVVIALSVLVSSINCRYALDERQWEGGDLRQHCIEVCDDDCEYCNPRNCTESEKYCGTTPSTVHPNCPPDESCVPLDCQCKSFTVSIVFNRAQIFRKIIYVLLLYM